MSSDLELQNYHFHDSIEFLKVWRRYVVQFSPIFKKKLNFEKAVVVAVNTFVLFLYLVLYLESSILSDSLLGRSLILGWLFRLQEHGRLLFITFTLKFLIISIYALYFWFMAVRLSLLSAFAAYLRVFCFIREPSRYRVIDSEGLEVSEPSRSEAETRGLNFQRQLVNWGGVDLD